MGESADGFAYVGVVAEPVDSLVNNRALAGRAYFPGVLDIRGGSGDANR